MIKVSKYLGELERSRFECIAVHHKRGVDGLRMFSSTEDDALERSADGQLQRSSRELKKRWL